MQARAFQHQWSESPTVWIPNHKLASYGLNVTHLVLPPGELWFCRLFNQALPEVSDPELAREVKTFVAQEGAHARGHRAVLERYEADGWDFSVSKNRLNWIFNHLLGGRILGRWQARGRWQRRWLRARIGIIAAIEHVTCVLGNWILYNTAIARAGGKGPCWTCCAGMGRKRWSTAVWPMTCITILGAAILAAPFGFFW